MLRSAAAGQRHTGAASQTLSQLSIGNCLNCLGEMRSCWGTWAARHEGPGAQSRDASCRQALTAHFRHPSNVRRQVDAAGRKTSNMSGHTSTQARAQAPSAAHAGVQYCTAWGSPYAAPAPTWGAVPANPGGQLAPAPAHPSPAQLCARWPAPPAPQHNLAARLRPCSAVQGRARNRGRKAEQTQGERAHAAAPGRQVAGIAYHSSMQHAAGGAAASPAVVWPCRRTHSQPPGAPPRLPAWRHAP